MAETVNIEQLEAEALEGIQAKKRCQQLEARCQQLEARCQDLQQENRALLLGYCLVGAFLAGVLYALVLDMLFD